MDWGHLALYLAGAATIYAATAEEAGGAALPLALPWPVAGPILALIWLGGR
jgi:hypothetical protein